MKDHPLENSKFMINHTFDRNGALVVDVDSIFKNTGIKTQIEAAKKVAELHRKNEKMENAITCPHCKGVFHP